MARKREKTFHLEEATIVDLHAAYRSGNQSCLSLVKAYLDRIEAYDKRGPAINAILTLNPKALEVARSFDRILAQRGFVGPLHGVPVVLKDNYETAEMATTAGSKALEKSIPSTDAFVVKKLRDAGALILAKTNTHELALVGLTCSSLGGQTRNPYDLTRTPGGSSGGTGAAIASNFAVLGTGTDTVNSIRSPSSANSLVGIRPTRGLISRAGIVPVSFTQDAVGPITRTVEDAARMLDVMVGYDPADPVTAWGVDNVPKTYTAYLKKGGLRGARLGVVRTLFGSKPEHEEVNRVMAEAITAMEKQGATPVDVEDPALVSAKWIEKGDVQRWEFKTVFNQYLEKLGPRAPVKTLAEFLATGNYHKASLEKFLTEAERLESPLDEPEYRNRLLQIPGLQQRLLSLMADHRLDALVYPLQKRLVVPIGDPDQIDRNGIIAALAGFPAIDVPAGFSKPTTTAPIGVPIGLDFLGRPWSEGRLIQLAYAFEQATKFRQPPRCVRPLAGALNGTGNT